MKEFIIVVLGMSIFILWLLAVILTAHKDVIDITDCKKYEYISGIKTASFDGTCYRFVNGKFVEVTFEELEKR